MRPFYWPPPFPHALPLGRIDADARRRGSSRTAWLHFAANSTLERAK
jgi:hypothetical protein